MKTAKLESDYSPGTFVRVSQTDDYDVVISITGKKDEEFRIATSGTHYHGENSVRFFHLCCELIDVMNAMEEGEKH
jgi:hypothetical protein